MIYCSDCRNFIDSNSECHAEQNKKVVSSPIGKDIAWERKPEEINSDNKCEWYIPRKPPARKPEKKVSVGISTILDHESRITVIENKLRGKKHGKGKDRVSDTSGPRGQDSGSGGKGKKEKKE